MYRPTPDVLTKILFSNWIQQKCGNYVNKRHPTAQDIETILKNSGWYVYEDGEGYPKLGTWLAGDILIGEELIWIPKMELITVVGTKFNCEENWIRTISKESRVVALNEEGRIRESCVQAWRCTYAERRVAG